MAGAAVAVALLAAGCATALGPGYAVERQEIQADFHPAPEPRVEVRGVWRVKNTGDRPLTALDVGIPDAITQQVSALRGEFGGAEAAAARTNNGHTARITLPNALSTGAKQEISLSYSLAAGASTGTGVVVDEAGFVLPPSGWAPALKPPSGQGSFARGGQPPKKWDITVRVPAGFRVYASGRARGEKKDAEARVFRFQQRGNEEPAFAVGGAYQEERIATAGGRVILWTREALPRELAARAAQEAGRTAEIYDSEFGTRPPRRARAGSVYLIECPGSRACAAVPGAALPGAEVHRAEFWSSGVRGIDRQLARSWLDFRVHPDWQLEPFPMGAIADYAADLAAIARAQSDARGQMIEALLGDFDAMAKAGQDRVILGVRLADPEAILQCARVKSELFFFALEDAAGHDAFHRALLHLLRTYAGQDWGATDLRSALEQESGKDLGPLFRAWLTESGIPADFRSQH